MKRELRVLSIAALALATALPTYAQNAAPQAAPAQPAPVCNNQPNCTENSRFAVQVTDFRTSAGAYNWKLVDVTLHFINKTPQSLILAYSEGTGVALDDQGNRYGVVNNANGVRGIGVVRGPNGDPKFELDPNDSGDAMFELGWPPQANVAVGDTFELDLTLREMNTLAGGAHTLGREFPLRFQGLQNGVAASSGAANGGQAANSGGQAPGAMTAAGGAMAPASGTPQAGGASNNASTTSSGGGILSRVQNATGTAAGTQQAGGSTASNNASTTNNSGRGGFLSRLQNATGTAPAAGTQQAGGSTASNNASTTNNSGRGGFLSRLQNAAQGQGLQVPGATGCPANQHCESVGPFTAEVRISAGGQNANVGLTLRNGTNQPTLVACKGRTGQLRDNLGHAFSLQPDPCASGRPVQLNPGQAVPVNFAFRSASGPIGNSFSYGVVIDQYQVLQNGQMQLLREYPVNFGGLSIPGAAPTRAATPPTRH